MVVRLYLSALSRGAARLAAASVFAIVVSAALFVAPLLTPQRAASAQDSGSPKNGKAKKGADDKAKPKKPEDPDPSGGGDDASNGGDPSDGTTGGDSKKKSTGTASVKDLSIDEQYIRENLEGYLHPSKIQWLDDGRVKMEFDFTQKNEDHETIFTPKVSKDMKSTFRWSVRDEYGWGYGGYGGGSSSNSKSGNNTDWWYGGLRMGMQGQSLLNCWFTDDVEIESSFAQFVSHTAKQSFAVTFTNESGNSIGNNYGTQCATFAKGRLEKVKGTIDQVLSEHQLMFKLAVKDGNFEALRDGKSKQKQEYSKKSYASGRVGFIWGGGIACIVHRMDVVGRIDAKKMATLLRKSAGKK